MAHRGGRDEPVTSRSRTAPAALPDNAIITDPGGRRDPASSRRAPHPVGCRAAQAVPPDVEQLAADPPPVPVPPGCALGQGVHLARPVAAADIIRRLTERGAVPHRA